MRANGFFPVPERMRVLLADDHTLLCAALRALIHTQNDLMVVGEASDGPEAVRQAKELSADVVVLDLTMPGGHGLPAIKWLRQSCPRCRILVLTMHEEYAQLRSVLASGASGYMVKTAPDFEFLAALRAVHRGQTVVDPTLTECLVQSALGTRLVSEPSPWQTAPVNLSDRQREILELLVHGYTNTEVADKLFLSPKTVEAHRARLSSKLGLKKRSDLVRYAAELGFMSPGTFPTKSRVR